MDQGFGNKVNAGYASQSYATGTASQVDESASAIRDGIGLSEQLLSELHERINQLESRLDTVLVPVGPTPNMPATNAKTPIPTVSHLRGRVGILNEGWQHAIERLSNIRARVEL